MTKQGNRERDLGEGAKDRTHLRENKEEEVKL